MGFNVDIVLFGFAKAFDAVSDHLLLDKLRLLGICSARIDWIANFIIVRVIKVLVSGICDGGGGGEGIIETIEFSSINSGILNKFILYNSEGRA